MSWTEFECNVGIDLEGKDFEFYLKHVTFEALM